MEYQVPQFIEEETKVVGPLSLRQFFIFLGAGLVSFVFFFLFKPWLWFVLSFILAAATIGLSFGRVHGRPASDMVLHALKFFWQPHLFVWKKKGLQAEDLFTEQIKKKTKKELDEARQLEALKRQGPKPLTTDAIKELARGLNKRAESGASPGATQGTPPLETSENPLPQEIIMSSRQDEPADELTPEKIRALAQKPSKKSVS